MVRLRRFVGSCWRCRAAIVRSPIVWRNVRALWVQSEPGWLDKRPKVELSEEEFTEYMEALE